MQSYHAALLSVCKACIPFATNSTIAGVDRSCRLVNAQRRKLRLGGPQVKSTNCLATLLEHARYLLSCQQDSTEHQETAWIFDVVVGQYLNDLGTAWVILVEFAELSCSHLLQNVQSSGILQLLTRAADRVTAEATAATPRTLQTSCVTTGIGVDSLWTALNHTFDTSLDKMLVGPSGQPLMSILRMDFKLMTLVSNHQAKQPANILQQTTLAFTEAVQCACSFANKEFGIAEAISAEQRALGSDPVFLQATAVALVLTVTQLRRLLAAAKPAASSSTAMATAVPTHHVELLRALHLEDAAALLASAAHGEEAQAQPQLLVIHVITELSAVVTAHRLALSMLCTDRGNSSGSQLQRTSTEPPAANLDLQQSSDQQAGQQDVNQQQPRQQQQQKHDLLLWLPALIDVMRELQLLAQQLQTSMQHVLHPLRPNDNAFEDCQQWAVAAMASICYGLVGTVLSQPEQQQQLGLRLTVLGNSCGHLEAALRGYGLVGKAETNEIVGQLNKLLLWLVSSSAAGQLASNASSSITVQGVCGLLLTYFKCLTAWLHTIISKDSSGTYSELTDNRVTAGIRGMLETASTGVRLAGMAMTTAAAANTRASGTLPDAAAAGLMLAGRSMYMAGEMTIKGKDLMLPDLYTPEGLPVYLSLPWGPSGFDAILEGLDMLLPQLKLPGAPIAARAAAAELQEQYQHFKQSLLERRIAGSTGEMLRLISDVDIGAPEQLVSFGAALCTQLPMPWCCNNFGCLNLSRESEQKLVGGKGCICSGCRPRRARYCGPECQKQHWNQHKPVCKRLR